MTITKEFFKRETNISVKVIADSISPLGQRITTIEANYPRFIHAELLTSRELSKNSSSSRAIPMKAMLKSIKNNLAMPLYWGTNNPGMQSKGELKDPRIAKTAWLLGSKAAMLSAVALNKIGLHKQLANRVTEPFQMMKVVITFTGIDNLLNLRLEKDAQPEFIMLAYKIYEAMSNSTPNSLISGEFHLPYIHTEEDGLGLYYTTPEKEITHDLQQAIKYSVARCATVSYRTSKLTLGKGMEIYEKLQLGEVLHASPYEHVATPTRVTHYDINNTARPETWEDGITHVSKQGILCSGNFKGWVQYRHLLDNNTCNQFNFEERMKTFGE